MVKTNSGVTDIQEYCLNELDASITLLYEFNDKLNDNREQYMHVKRKQRIKNRLWIRRFSVVQNVRFK